VVFCWDWLVSVDVFLRSCDLDFVGECVMIFVIFVVICGMCCCVFLLILLLCLWVYGLGWFFCVCVICLL